MGDLLLKAYACIVPDMENEIVGLKNTIEELKGQLVKREDKVTELTNIIKRMLDINKRIVDEKLTNAIVMRDEEIKSGHTQIVSPEILTQPCEEEKVVRDRVMVRRKTLYEVLRGQPRKFKVVIDKKEYFTDGNGKDFSNDVQHFRSLNHFLENSVKAATGDDRRKISVYDEKRGVQIQHLNGVWEFLGACYKETTKLIH